MPSAVPRDVTPKQEAGRPFAAAAGLLRTCPYMQHLHEDLHFCLSLGRAPLWGTKPAPRQDQGILGSQPRALLMEPFGTKYSLFSMPVATLTPCPWVPTAPVLRGLQCCSSPAHPPGLAQTHPAQVFTHSRKQRKVAEKERNKRRGKKNRVQEAP